MDQLDTARELIKRVAWNGTQLVLPVDVLVADIIDSNANMRAVAVEHIPPGMKIVDIGAHTASMFQEKLNQCNAIFWNGPMGVYEVPLFSLGTKSMAHAIAGLGATSIIAGGSTADIVDNLNLSDKIDFVSTGGGASLEFLSGTKLPGVEALPDIGQVQTGMSKVSARGA
jgi:phosphoglycerate kinase